MFLDSIVQRNDFGGVGIIVVLCVMYALVLILLVRRTFKSFKNPEVFVSKNGFRLVNKGSFFLAILLGAIVPGIFLLSIVYYNVYKKYSRLADSEYKRVMGSLYKGMSKRELMNVIGNRFEAVNESYNSIELQYVKQYNNGDENVKTEFIFEDDRLIDVKSSSKREWTVYR